LLPALAGRMPAWIEDDPQRAILLGICRRAWSQNQVQKKVLADAVEILAAAGIERVAAIGPVLWGSLYWPDGAIRPIDRVDLLVEPAAVVAALEALSKAGCKPSQEIPDPAKTPFYFAGGALLKSATGGELRLHWRALPNTDFSIRRPAFPPLEALPPGSASRYTIPLEYALVAALSGHYQDAVGWQLDALMICRQPGIPWDRVGTLLRWRSAQRKRLAQLRREGAVEVPPMVTRPKWTSPVEQLLASALRVYRRLKRG